MIANLSLAGDKIFVDMVQILFFSAVFATMGHDVEEERGQDMLTQMNQRNQQRYAVEDYYGRGGHSLKGDQFRWAFPAILVFAIGLSPHIDLRSWKQQL